MRPPRSSDETTLIRRLQAALSAPRRAALAQSKTRVKNWFTQEAPVIHWSEMRSPLGPLFVATSARGLCAVDFGRNENDFIARLDPRARLVKETHELLQVTLQLKEYFAGQRTQFDLPLDLSALTPFQKQVLETACRIAPGQVWSYLQVARKMGRPKSSRPVGQALAHNPVPIVIPCHRVIAADGSLGGYSGGAGLSAKRWLLRLEGARL
ncbi:MAG TPA: methylated-DNA--[protein]-cysteine S-methyltransferase [Terriglobales bacterium]|nr:methylated-DNA--[protein]-cysteine S-methyltransferase [Terriglobales bacterium]